MTVKNAFTTTSKADYPFQFFLKESLFSSKICIKNGK